MLRRLARGVILLGLAGALVFWVLPRPVVPDADALPEHVPDPVAGERVFHLGGCAGCHAAPGAEGPARLVLAGGRRLPSPFGTFVAPNISPDPDHGIGRWTVGEFVNAVKFGVSPGGAHYYPALPYTSYIRARTTELMDLWAYIRTLPPSAEPSRPHELPFPFNVRRGVGLWKRLFLDPAWVMQDPPDPEAARGRELVEGLGHCGECHTPRNPLGALDRARWMAGAPAPDGKGKVPALTPDRLRWSKADIVYYLKTGFTPDFDSAGGEMAEVVENLSALPDRDLAAIAAYLKALPPASGR